jgi:hypothetical protein
MAECIFRTSIFSDPHHPEVHVPIVQLARKGQSSILRVSTSARLPTYFVAVASVSDVPELVKSILDASMAALKPAVVSLDAFNSQYLQRHLLRKSCLIKMVVLDFPASAFMQHASHFGNAADAR